jgi:hypothetical protein
MRQTSRLTSKKIATWIARCALPLHKPLAFSRSGRVVMPWEGARRRRFPSDKRYPRAPVSTMSFTRPLRRCAKSHLAGVFGGTTTEGPELKSEPAAEFLMNDTSSGVGGLDRRGFIQLAAAGGALAGGLSTAVAQPSESLADITRQPNPELRR